MNQEPATGEKLSWLTLIAVIALWVGMYLPNLGMSESAREEGRRVLTSIEMIETGDWVLPTIWGRPYLTKPPMMFWSIVVCSLPQGEVTLWSARMPSALATLATALMILWLGTRFGSRTTGMLGAVIFLATPMTTDKGTLAETEALLAFFSFASLVLAFVGHRGSRLATVASVFALSGAVMTKGPAAYVFFYAGPVALLFVDRKSALPLLVRCLLIGLGSVALSAFWLVALLALVDGDLLATTWAAEVKRGDQHSFVQYLSDRARYLLRAFTGFLPGSLLFLVARGGRPESGNERVAVQKLAMGCVIAGFLFFALYPGSRARYAYPILPWLSFLGGFWLLDGLRSVGPGRRGLNALAALCGIVGILGGLAALSTIFGVELMGLSVEWAGLLCGVALVVAGGSTLQSLRSENRRGALLGLLAVLILVRGFYLTTIIPTRADRHDFIAKAAQLDAALPPGVRVHTADWGDFNLFAHASVRPLYTTTPLESVQTGEVLLAEKTWLEDQGGGAALPGWDLLIQIPVRHGRELVALRRR